MTRPLILFHADCADGHCAAWVLWRHFCDEADYLPVQYGQEPPNVAGREVYILDFSYKRPVMRQILSQARKVVVLDHHETAEAELADIVDEFLQRPDLLANPPGSELPFIRFDMAKSGGRLAWEYAWDRWYAPKYSSILDGGQHLTRDNPPWLVAYTEDHDLWRWKLPHSQEINAALATYPRDFATWDTMAEWDKGRKAWEAFQEEGAAVLRYQSQLVESIAATARECEIDGHRVLAANTSCLFSEVAEKLAQGRPFGAAWFIRSDGKKQWSLRSREGGIDVSQVAKQRGGGGHFAAAGFEE